jgi:hypothetical protein
MAANLEPIRYYFIPIVTFLALLFTFLYIIYERKE